jgi:predicted nucleotidyltransferase component of viral defense system
LTGQRLCGNRNFAYLSEETVLEVCGVIDGASVSGFEFSLKPTRGDGRHWELQVEHSDLGRPDIPASVEFARRPIVLVPELLPFVGLPVQKAYEVQLPSLPVIAEAEACAEKLARYRRTALVRNVYDLAKFAGRIVDESLVRRLWVLKVWGDVVDDNRGIGPLDPMDVLVERREKDFAQESIGKLTQPVNLVVWERTVRRGFAFLVDLDEEEQPWAACDPRHRSEIETAQAHGGFSAE